MISCRNSINSSFTSIELFAVSCFHGPAFAVSSARPKVKGEKRMKGRADDSSHVSQVQKLLPDLKKKNLKYSMTAKGIQYSILQSERLIKETSSEKTNFLPSLLCKLYLRLKDLWGMLITKFYFLSGSEQPSHPDLAFLKCIDWGFHPFLKRGPSCQ